MTDIHNTKLTDFGYQQVPESEKASKVGEVFTKVAPKYDIMNDLMSLGLHRLWKKFAIAEANIKPGQWVLDVAAGSGDLSKALSQLVGKHGRVIMTDINPAMLEVGRARLMDAGCYGNIDFIQADAQDLPFPSNSFDCITIAFGLRNVTDKLAALRSMHRVLKPGGKLLILEFSHPQNPLVKSLYDAYSFKVIPKLGEIIAKDRASYQYLVESIRMHPNQEKLKELMEAAGLEDIRYYNLNGGIVALHKGFKF